MTKIEQIIEELSDSEKSLTNPLLKTKVLVTRIGNMELLKWTNDELSGYKAKELPTYRLGKLNITCTMQKNNYIYNNVPLPLMVFGSKLPEALLHFRFDDSIQTLEIQEKENKNGTIYKEFGPDMCAYITKLANDAGQNFVITTMQIEVHVSQITQVLAEVRSKLLDFMLQLEKEIPNLDELMQDKLEPKTKVKDKMDQIFHQTFITTSGFGNTVTAGDSNNVTSSNKIIIGNISELKSELEKINVPIENIDEIIHIVQEEEPYRETGKFRNKVNTWIQKMYGKALDGTWEIGASVAGGVLVELIKAYYKF